MFKIRELTKLRYSVIKTLNSKQYRLTRPTSHSREEPNNHNPCTDAGREAARHWECCQHVIGRWWRQFSVSIRRAGIASRTLAASLGLACIPNNSHTTTGINFQTHSSSSRVYSYFDGCFTLAIGMTFTCHQDSKTQINTYPALTLRTNLTIFSNVGGMTIWNENSYF